MFGAPIEVGEPPSLIEEGLYLGAETDFQNFCHVAQAFKIALILRCNAWKSDPTYQEFSRSTNSSSCYSEAKFLTFEDVDKCTTSLSREEFVRKLSQPHNNNKNSNKNSAAVAVKKGSSSSNTEQESKSNSRISILIYNIPAADNEDFPLQDYFPEACSFISQRLAVKDGYTVGVHCQVGVSRSATIVCAYLMKKYNWSAEKAIHSVRMRRPIIYPNAGFVRQLEVWFMSGFSGSPSSGILDMAMRLGELGREEYNATSTCYNNKGRGDVSEQDRGKPSEQQQQQQARVEYLERQLTVILTRTRLVESREVLGKQLLCGTHPLAAEALQILTRKMVESIEDELYCDVPRLFHNWHQILSQEFCCACAEEEQKQPQREKRNDYHEDEKKKKEEETVGSSERNRAVEIGAKKIKFYVLPVSILNSHEIVFDRLVTLVLAGCATTDVIGNFLSSSHFGKGGEVAQLICHMPILASVSDLLCPNSSPASGSTNFVHFLALLKQWWSVGGQLKKSAVFAIQLNILNDVCLRLKPREGECDNNSSSSNTSGSKMEEIVKCTFDILMQGLECQQHGMTNVEDKEKEELRSLAPDALFEELLLANEEDSSCTGTRNSSDALSGDRTGALHRGCCHPAKTLLLDLWLALYFLCSRTNATHEATMKRDNDGPDESTKNSVDAGTKKKKKKKADDDPKEQVLKGLTLLRQRILMESCSPTSPLSEEKKKKIETGQIDQTKVMEHCDHVLHRCKKIRDEM